MTNPDITICGAGIAGVASAYFISQRYPEADIVLVDRLAPLSLTTAQSGENFREYWPQPCLRDFCSRSIELMDKLSTEYPDSFEMRYSGYEFISRHHGRPLFEDDPGQAPFEFERLQADSDLHRKKPYLDPSVKQLFKLNRAGVMDVYAFGTLLLKLARANGVKFIQSEVKNLHKESGSYLIELADRTIASGQLVLCAGPFNARLAALLGFDLPIHSVVQRKFVMPDPAGVIPRDMPFTIIADKQKLRWSEQELELISKDPDFAHLLAEYPAGLHIKPEGRNQVKLGWAYNREIEEPAWQLQNDPQFAEIVIRGASAYLPGLGQYLARMPTPLFEFAGYYTRTTENLPLIGKLDDNLLLVGALAGYGTMAASAAGELCSLYAGQPAMAMSGMPGYARYMSPRRIDDPGLMQEINSISSDGQL